MVSKKKVSNLPTEAQIRKYAEEKNDIQLAFAYASISGLYDYMEKKLAKGGEYLPWVSEEDKEKCPKRDTVLSRVKANGKRYKQLQGWLKKEEVDTYKAFYTRESKILEKYILTLIGELIREKADTEEEINKIAEAE